MARGDISTLRDLMVAYVWRASGLLLKYWLGTGMLKFAAEDFSETLVQADLPTLNFSISFCHYPRLVLRRHQRHLRCESSLLPLS